MTSLVKSTEFLNSLEVFLLEQKSKLLESIRQFESEIDNPEDHIFFKKALKVCKSLYEQYEKIHIEKIQLRSNLEFCERKINKLSEELLGSTVFIETLRRQIKQSNQKKVKTIVYNNFQSEKKKPSPEKHSTHEQILNEEDIMNYVINYHQYLEYKQNQEKVKSKVEYLKMKMQKNKESREKEVFLFDKKEGELFREKRKYLKSLEGIRGVYKTPAICQEAESQCQNIIEKIEKQYDQMKEENEKKLRIIRCSMDNLEKKYDQNLTNLTSINDIVNSYERDPDFAAVKNSHKKKKRRDGNKFPPAKKCVLVFTDIKDSTAIWEKDMDLAAEGLRVHNKCCREVMKKWKGYEIKFEGDAFLIAFHNVFDAVNFSMDVQAELLNCNWPEGFKAMKETEEVFIKTKKKKVIMFSGMRIRISIHTGKEIMLKIDEKTQRADYLGPVVNKCARLNGLARGGEIVFSENVFSLLNENLSRIKSRFVIKVRGFVEMKGFREKEKLRSITEKRFLKRKYPEEDPLGKINSSKSQFVSNNNPNTLQIEAKNSFIDALLSYVENIPDYSKEKMKICEFLKQIIGLLEVSFFLF